MNQVLRAFISNSPRKNEGFWLETEVTGVNAVGEAAHSHSEAIQRTPNRLVWILLFPTLLNTWLFFLGKRLIVQKPLLRKRGNTRLLEESWPDRDVAESPRSFCEALDVTNISHEKDFLAWLTYGKSRKGV